MLFIAIDHIWRINSQSYSMTHFDERMTFHCRGALDTIRLISVDLRISVHHVLHVAIYRDIAPSGPFIHNRLILGLSTGLC